MNVLDVRVLGVNRAHAYANELRPRLIEAFRPFVGQKVEKVDGPLLAKVQKVVDALELPNGFGSDIHVYRHISNYSLAYSVKSCECLPARGGDHAYYYEVTVYVGEMRDGVLTGLTEGEWFKENYKPEDVLAAREAYKKAKAAADAAQAKLFPFGEYDR